MFALGPRTFASLAARPRAGWVIASLLLFTLSKPASATFSLLAVHSESAARGAAIASCVGDSLSLEDVVVVDRRFGVLVLQGYFSAQERDELETLLLDGMAPDAALSARTAPGSRGDDGLGPEYRQIAIVGMDGTNVGYSGSELSSFAADVQIKKRGWALSIQGNILDGGEVLSNLEEGFFESDEVNLQARLARSLLRVVESGKGDARCSPNSADQFFVVSEERGREREADRRILPKAKESRAFLEEIVTKGSLETSSGCALARARYRKGGALALLLLLVAWCGRRLSRSKVVFERND